MATERSSGRKFSRFIERIPSKELLRLGDFLSRKDQSKNPLLSDSEAATTTTCSSTTTVTFAIGSSSTVLERRKKRGPLKVSFHQSVQVALCEHADDYTDAEYAATWYTTEELHALKKERKRTIRLVQKISTLPKSMTFRGLECQTKLGHLERTSNILSGLMAVVNQQAQLKGSKRRSDDDSEQSSNEEAIRSAYLPVTQHCLQQAIKRAQKDAQAAKRYQEKQPKKKENELNNEDKFQTDCLNPDCFKTSDSFDTDSFDTNYSNKSFSMKRYQSVRRLRQAYTKTKGIFSTPNLDINKYSFKR